MHDGFKPGKERAMKLLIHDLPAEAFSNFAPEYEGWEIIAARGDIRPCVGCFGCWVKTPGRCVVKDGYEDSPVKLHQAEEIVFLSRLRYGCLSGAAKNVIDRCIGYVLPFFEIAHGEMHHQRRYDEEKPVSFRFYGPSTPAERAQAEEYAAAVCRNMRSRVKAVTFEDYDFEREAPAQPKAEPAARTVLLNCSSRGKQANSAMFLEKLAAKLKTPCETLELAQHLRAPEALIPKLLGAEQIVIGAGLYVDGPPSQLLRLLEALEAVGGMEGKRIYAVTNMGLYESRQLRNLFNTLRLWCKRTGAVYSGGLAIGAGEMYDRIGSIPFETGPGRNIDLGAEKLAKAIDAGTACEDIYANPFAFPRIAYVTAANLGWPGGGKKNGLSKEDLYQQHD